MKIDGGNRSTGRKPTQRNFVHHKSQMTRPGFEPEPATSRLSDGAASDSILLEPNMKALHHFYAFFARYA
jgi:hypothetical protein